MNEPVRQHFVPQSYLKHFARKKDRVWVVDVKDKKRKSPYCSDIKNVAFQKNMYTIEGDKEPYRWEKFFADVIEPLMAKTSSILIQRCSSVVMTESAKIIDSPLQSDLMIIIWSQLLRTPKGMNYLNEMSKEILPGTLDIIRKTIRDSLPIELKEFLDKLIITDSIRKECIMRASQGIPRGKEVNRILRDKTWILFKLPKSDKLSFHTGDHPVCIFNNNNKSETLFEIGIADPGTVIFYPINPQILLAIYSEKIYYGILNEYDSKCQRLDLNTESRFINTVNNIIYRQCTQHTFSYPNETLNK